MNEGFMINTCYIINIEEKNNNNLSLHFCLNITEQQVQTLIYFYIYIHILYQ